MGAGLCMACVVNVRYVWHQQMMFYQVAQQSQHTHP